MKRQNDIYGLQSTPFYKEVEYPVPWRKVVHAARLIVAEKAGGEWRRRTWWGKLKLLVALPFLLVLGLLVPVLVVLFEPTILIVPVVDAISRLEKYTMDVPATYKEGQR